MEGQQWTKLASLLNKSDIDYENLTIPEAFTKFYSRTNISEYKEWIEGIINDTPKKSNVKAEILRNLGNKEHICGNFKEAIKLYSLSLQFAIYNGVDYGKALANRSAATFAIGEFGECLKDIRKCFHSEYPDELRSKVLLRQLQCYTHLYLDTDFNNAIKELPESLKENEIYKRCVETYKNKSDTKQEGQNTHTNTNEIEMNDRFAYAANLIELQYTAGKGRQVIAACDIKAGDILFREKAFVTAQIFKSREELEPEVCYYCLEFIPYHSLPCTSCTYCFYCSESCKELSCKESHRFECPGMIIFYEIGQALPAFKFLMKGIPLGFPIADNTSTKFGSVDDNYASANSLIIHFEQRKDKMHLLGVAFIVVLYLRTKTDFFDYFKGQMKIYQEWPKDDELDILVGYILVKHMVQLFCNGSIIERKSGDKFRPIAAGIYPSISMMNHSCKSNINIAYIGNVAIVKAVEDIPRGKEVVNSYGVDYTTHKAIRQEYLLENYGFLCNCSFCSNNT